MRNRAGCMKCRDVIESTHTHDYVSCECGEIAVDGGQSYFRRTFKNRESICELPDGKSLDDFEQASDLIQQITEPIDSEEIARLLRMDGYDSNPCHPDNGGIGGVRPWCRACGAMTPPWIPCGRSDCDHRVIG